ncbi:MAG TPA: SEC-C metal-binding domain-containing protein, partial [Actinomycetota bacterium]|nr:SEC-C metal-binding domain-containing protein [Actinomycetota bacterium]
MDRLKWPEDEPIAARMVTRAVESAQRQIEELNFERRKNILKYDDVMNTQRQVIYGEREKILNGEDFKEQALDFVTEVVEGTVSQWIGDKTFAEEWDLDALLAGLAELYPTRLTRQDLERAATAAELSEMVLTDALALYEEKEQAVGSQVMRELERMVLMSLTDNKWREHLYEMDYLQEGIHLRAYGQRDPLTEYRREAFDMFEELTQGIREEFVRYIFRVELVRQDEPSRPRPQRVVTSRGETDEGAGAQAKSGKVPRNAPCPCGSGKKYKKCHGAVA